MHSCCLRSRYRPSSDSACRRRHEGDSPDDFLSAHAGGRRGPLGRGCGRARAPARRRGRGRLAARLPPLRDRLRLRHRREPAPPAGPRVARAADAARTGARGPARLARRRPRARALAAARWDRDAARAPLRRPALGDGRRAGAAGAVARPPDPAPRAADARRLERARRRCPRARRGRGARDWERRRSAADRRRGGHAARGALRGPALGREGNPRSARGRGQRDEADDRRRRTAARAGSGGARLRPSRRARAPVRPCRRRRSAVAPRGLRRRLRGGDGAWAAGRRRRGRRPARPGRGRGDGPARATRGRRGVAQGAAATARRRGAACPPRRECPPARPGDALVGARHRPDACGLRGGDRMRRRLRCRHGGRGGFAAATVKTRLLVAPARALGREGVPVHGIAVDEREFGLRSRYLTGKGLVRSDEDVLELLRRFPERPVLFPERDENVAFVLRNWAAVRELADVPLPEDPEIVVRLRRKERLPIEGAAAGVAAPATVLARDEETIRAADLQPPLLVKPAEGQEFALAFGEKAVVALDADAAVAAWRRAHEHGFDTIVQELIPEPHDFVFSLLTYIGREGEPLASVTGRKVRQGPLRFGTSAVFEARREPEVEEQGLRLLRHVGYTGFAHVELVRDPRDGELKLVEVNTRLPIWAGIAMGAGRDFN